VNALLWAFIIALVAFLIIRRSRTDAMSARQALEAARQTLVMLSSRPVRVLALLALSLISFLLLDVALWLVAAAYTSHNVILHIDHQILLLALVAGYLAKFVQITPGGMGQFEWAFASALYLSGGVGQPEAMIMALLIGGIRLVTGGATALVIGSLIGVETSFRRVMNVFRREPLMPEAAGA
jgi:uncharacterized membrane protein YbhN (UPF0104 family)